MTLMIKCIICHGSGWACEAHPRKPWGGMCCDGRPPAWKRALRILIGIPEPAIFRCRHGACFCGAPGEACDCNPMGDVEWLEKIAEV